jgi:hypothetical protein
LDVVTDTLYDPAAAPLAIVNVAVICEPFTTTTLPAVTPLPLTPTVAPETKFVPVNVTFTAVPCTPLFGATDVSVGVDAEPFTVKGTAPVTPPGAATVTLCPPAEAFDAMLNVAVICVELTITGFDNVNPPPATEIVELFRKPVPVRVTGTLVPAFPLDGLTETSVGGG